MAWCPSSRRRRVRPDRHGDLPGAGHPQAPVTTPSRRESHGRLAKSAEVAQNALREDLVRALRVRSQRLRALATGGAIAECVAAEPVEVRCGALEGVYGCERERGSVW